MQCTCYMVVMQRTCYSQDRAFNVLNCMSIHHTCYLKAITAPLIFMSCSAHVTSRSCNPFAICIQCNVYVIRKVFNTHTVQYNIQVMQGT